MPSRTRRPAGMQTAVEQPTGTASRLEAPPDAAVPSDASVPTSSRAQVLAGAVGLVLVLAFGLMVARHSGWSARELPVLVWLSAHHVAALGTLAAALAVVLSPATALVWLAVAGALGARHRGVRFGVLLFAVGGAGLAGAVLVKFVVRRARPDVSILANPPAVDTSYSYPSGHTVVATIVVLLLVVALGRQHRRWTIPMGTAVVLVAATSRLYLGLHYPTDVVAAIVYGLCATPVLIGLLGVPPVHAVLTRLHLLPAVNSRPEGAPQ